jgi:hypothetical protein
MVRCVGRNARVSSHHAIAAARLDLGQATRDLIGAAARALGVLVESGLEADRHERLGAGTVSDVWYSRCRIRCCRRDLLLSTTSLLSQQQQDLSCRSPSVQTPRTRLGGDGGSLEERGTVRTIPNHKVEAHLPTTKQSSSPPGASHSARARAALILLSRPTPPTCGSSRLRFPTRRWPKPTYRSPQQKMHCAPSRRPRK